MFRNLSPGAVGVQLPPDELLPAAAAAGFEGVDPILSRPAADMTELFAAHGLQIGAMGLPVNFRSDEAAFQKGLQALPSAAANAQAVGCTRCATWLAPASDELTYAENFDLHVRRLRPVAMILADHGIRFGLEFVGPKTSRQSKGYEFVHRLDQALELCEAVGVANMGLLLDAWHWYTSGGTVEELRTLADEQIVQVHVNDAPEGIAVDQQVDNVRALPGATGVIDITSFLGALQAIGYSGPVTPEPFCAELRDMPPRDALRTVGDAMQNIWIRAGL